MKYHFSFWFWHIDLTSDYNKYNTCSDYNTMCVCVCVCCRWVKAQCVLSVEDYLNLHQKANRKRSPLPWWQICRIQLRMESASLSQKKKSLHLPQGLTDTQLGHLNTLKNHFCSRLSLGRKQVHKYRCKSLVDALQCINMFNKHCYVTVVVTNDKLQYLSGW